MKKINEKELKDIFEGIKNDDKLDFEKLYKNYNRLVYGIAFSILKNKYDTEDVVQMVFTKLYALEKDKLPTKSEASWLYSVTKNETLTYLKNKKNNIDLDNLYEIEDGNNEINQIVAKDSFNRMISNLNEKEKEIISLKVLSNLSFEEIGKVLNTPIGTVKWRYYKSVHTIKLLLSNLGMFVVTLVSSIFVSKNGMKSSSQIVQDNCVENNIAIKDEELNDFYDTEFAEKNENTVNKDNTSQTIENVIVEIPQENNGNYLGWSLIGASVIFLILTITFLITYVRTKGRCLCP